MAIVKGPALSIDASGNLGNICYAKWRGFQIARAAWSGTPTPTPLQTDQKDRVVTVCAAWSGTLNEAERQSWRAAAADQIRMTRVNTTYIPTGYQYFIGLNIQVLRQGFGIRKLPPVKGKPFGFTRLRVVWQGDPNFRFAIYAVDRLVLMPTTMTIEFWKAGPFSAGGYHAQPYDYRFLVYENSPIGYRDDAVNQDAYYWYRARWAESTGVVGNWYEMQGYSG